MAENSAHIEPHVHVGDLLKESVFGFNDGLVSTFAVIAGLHGGGVEHRTVLLAALATLFAGAFSMGLGTYLGSKSEKEHYEREREREIYEMKHMPDIERKEICDIYSAKGFKGELLERVVDQITSDPKVWLQTMMTEELGFAGAPPRPGLNGIIMSTAFIMGSLVASFPYFFSEIGIIESGRFIGESTIFLVAFAASFVGLCAAGAAKTKFTGRPWFLGALETLIVGALAAAGSYSIGLLFS